MQTQPQSPLAHIIMIKFTRNRIQALIISLIFMTAAAIFPSCKSSGAIRANGSYTEMLTDTISKIVSEYPGEIGVAVIINNSDTATLNNRNVYPMMSVFKMHQALAICNYFDRNGLSLDSIITIKRAHLDPDTWSPMMKDHPEEEFSLSVKELLQYTLIQSDNNASNLMFKHLVDAAHTDHFIATLIPRSSFRIAYTEEEMSADHDKAYSNRTSPLGAAMLINRLFTDSIVSREKQCFIINTLKQCLTGKDRIIAPLIEKDGISTAHKTGSGYINEKGELAAHNDVAYIMLPGNIRYSLAVFVKDFKGNEAQASTAISRISAAVYSVLAQ